MKREELNEMELNVLQYWEKTLGDVLERNSTAYGYNHAYSLIKSGYRNIRLYTERREYINGRFQTVSNIKKEYEPAIRNLLENKILTMFSGRGGKFYQLSKLGFEMLFGKGKEGN